MTFRQFLGIVEIRTKIISMATFGMGTLYALYRTGEFSLIRFLIMLISVLCVDMGTTGFNAFFDFRSGTDRAKDNREKNKVLLHEGVRADMALTVSLLLYLAAGVTGIILAWMTSWYLLAVGGVCMAVGYLYTGGPLPIARTPFGEMAAGGFLGTVLFGISYYIQTETVSWEAFLVSLSASAVVASILTANNTCDSEGDRQAGRLTLSILLGRKAGELIIYLLGFAAYGWTGVMIVLGYLPGAAAYSSAAGLAGSILIYRTMHTIGYRAESKDPIMGSVAKIYLLFALTSSAGLLWSIVFR